MKNRPILFVTFLFVLILIGANTYAQFQHPGGIHSREQIRIAKQKITEEKEPVKTTYDSLLIHAKLNLTKVPQAPADFNVPGYYDDAKGHRQTMAKLSEDAWTAYSCAVAWQLTQTPERKKYAQKAKEVLMNWATINKRTSNFDGDLAMVDAGVGLIFAAELLSDFNAWKENEKQTFKTWVRTVYLHSSTKISDEENNWGDWGTLGCLASFHFLDEPDSLTAYTLKLKQKINTNIAANGHMPHEVKRGKRGLWYTYFSLAPLTASCQIVKVALNENIFHYKGDNGAGIEEALDYLLYFSRFPEEWPHYDGTALNRGKPTQYPGNLFEAMYGIYQKQKYCDWVKDSRPIMPFGHHYAWTFPTLLQPLPINKN